MDAQPLLSLRLSVDYPGKPGRFARPFARHRQAGNSWTGRAKRLRQEHAGAGHLEASLSEARPGSGFDSLQWPRPDGFAASGKFDLFAAKKLG